MTPPRKVKSKKSQGNVRRVRAWAVIEHEKLRPKYIYTNEDFCYAPSDTFCVKGEFIYQLPSSGRRKKEKRR